MKDEEGVWHVPCSTSLFHPTTNDHVGRNTEHERLTKDMKRIFNIICLMSCLLVATTTSCTMMEVDRSDCPEGLFVSFRYDYNLHGNLFADQVGAVTVYVLDTLDRVVAAKTVENRPDYAPMKQSDFAVHFAGLQPGLYRVMAVAQQAGTNDITQRGGTHFDIPQLQQGESIEHLNIRLPHDATPTTVELKDRQLSAYAVDNGGVSLDTLWHTLGDKPRCEVSDMRATYVTVPLIRDTKLINLTIRQTENADELQHTDYDVYITADNAELDAHNAIIPDRPLLLYRPFAEWTTSEKNSVIESGTDSEVVGNSLHYNLSVSRLMYYTGDEGYRNAKLYVVNSKTKALVVVLNLPEYLSYGRDAYAMERYSVQEYLDRQDNFDMDLIIVGGRLSAVVIRIGIIRWQHRIQINDI